MATIIDTIIASLKDLVKFKVVGLVNTGDKTQDNLINALLLSIVTWIFATFSNREIAKWRYHIMQKIPFSKKATKALVAPTLTQESITHYTELANSGDIVFSHVSWYLEDTIPSMLFTERVSKHFITVYPITEKTTPYYYDPNEKQLKNFKHATHFNTIKTRISNAAKYMPVFVDENGMICMVYANEHIMIAHNSVQTFDAFIKSIESIDVTTVKPTVAQGESKIRSIWNINGEKIGRVYPDRTLDIFISRHKETIMRALESFTTTNNSNSSYHGCASYNLGMIVHGPPGTGKTMLVKAIANYIKRDVYFINLRKIKTRKQFEALFTHYENYVIYLDEFDCIQGVIKQRTDDINESTRYADEIKDLKARHIATIQLMANTVDTESRKEHKKELDKIEASLLELEDVLTLDTVLTVLDGIQEMRGRIIIATTNFLDKIDSALLRSGRFDLKIHLDKFTSVEIQELLCLMYKDVASKEELETIRNTRFKENTYTPPDIIQKVTIRKNMKEVIEEMSDV